MQLLEQEDVIRNFVLIYLGWGIILIGFCGDVGKCLPLEAIVLKSSFSLSELINLI